MDKDYFKRIAESRQRRIDTINRDVQDDALAAKKIKDARKLAYIGDRVRERWERNKRQAEKENA